MATDVIDTTMVTTKGEVDSRKIRLSLNVTVPRPFVTSAELHSSAHCHRPPTTLAQSTVYPAHVNTCVAMCVCVPWLPILCYQFYSRGEQQHAPPEDKEVVEVLLSVVVVDEKQVLGVLVTEEHVRVVVVKCSTHFSLLIMKSHSTDWDVWLPLRPVWRSRKEPFTQ